MEATWPPRTAVPTDFAALRTFDRERDNIRAALAWAIAQQDAGHALRLASALAEYWHLRGDFAEARAWFVRVLPLAGGPPSVRAAALYGAAIHADAQGDSETALILAEESLDLALRHGDAIDELRARLAASGPTYRWRTAEQATANVHKIVALAQQIDNPHWLGYAAISPGYDHLRHAEYQQATNAFDDAIARFAQVSDPWGEMNAIYGLALALHAREDWARLVPLYRRIIILSEAIATPWGAIRGIEGLATIGARHGHAAAAAHLLGAAEALIERMGHRLNPEGQALREETRQRLQADLGNEGFQAAWGAGHLLTLPEAQEEAIALSARLEHAGQPGHVPESDRAIFTRTQGVLRAPPSFDLTRREREILKLLCHRLTDPEIAEQLYISHHTASKHVSNVLGKLGVANRREAAAFAARHNLV